MKLAGGDGAAASAQERVHTKGTSHVRWVRSRSFYSGKDKQQQQQQGTVITRGSERSCGGDDSPVSVIHAATCNMQLSHPSSACTSMEHPLSPLHPPPHPPPLLLNHPSNHQYPPHDQPCAAGLLSERVHQAFSKSQELNTSKSGLNLDISDSMNASQTLNPDQPYWPKKRMEWLNLQEVSPACSKMYVESQGFASPAEHETLDDHAAEEVFSIYTRDQDEDSVIDFFPSTNRSSSAVQLRRRSYDRINSELGNGRINDNPERVLLSGSRAPAAGMKKAMRHSSGEHDDDDHEEEWSRGRMPSSKWDDAERWLTSPASSSCCRVRSHRNGGHLHFMLPKAGCLQQLVQTAAANYKFSDPSTQDKHVPENLRELKNNKGGKFGRGSHGAAGAMREAGTEVKLEKKRDMATQSTPAEWSRCDSPDAEGPIYSTGAEKVALANYGTEGPTSQKTSPPRHNTPARRSVSCTKKGGTRQGLGCAPAHFSAKLNLIELESCHLDKLKLARDLPLGTSSTWVLYPEEDTETTPLCDMFLQRKTPTYENSSYPQHAKVNMLEARVSAWEDVERAKHIAKFKREEAKIEAWESLQRAEADAELQKLEVKLEKMRFEGRDKIMGRLGCAQRRAQELRATAEAHKTEQLTRVEMRANQIRKTGHLPSSTFNVVCSLTTKIKPTSNLSFA